MTALATMVEVEGSAESQAIAFFSFGSLQQSSHERRKYRMIGAGTNSKLA
jgi:hypothetical protein